MSPSRNISESLKKRKEKKDNSSDWVYPKLFIDRQFPNFWNVTQQHINIPNLKEKRIKLVKTKQNKTKEAKPTIVS